MKAGEEIRRIRSAQGVPQEALALRAGTSQAAISDIERGRVSPSAETLERLLLCLGHELRVEARPLAMDTDLESLREIQRLTPAQRLRRIAATASFVRRHRRTEPTPRT